MQYLAGLAAGEVLCVWRGVAGTWCIYCLLYYVCVLRHAPSCAICDKLEADLRLGAVLNDPNQMSRLVAKVRRVAFLGQGG
jgi:hypothetical protein